MERLPWEYRQGLYQTPHPVPFPDFQSKPDRAPSIGLPRRPAICADPAPALDPLRARLVPLNARSLLTESSTPNGKDASEESIWPTAQDIANLLCWAENHLTYPFPEQPSFLPLRNGRTVTTGALIALAVALWNRERRRMGGTQPELVPVVRLEGNVAETYEQLSAARRHQDEDQDLPRGKKRNVDKSAEGKRKRQTELSDSFLSVQEEVRQRSAADVKTQTDVMVDSLRDMYVDEGGAPFLVDNPAFGICLIDYEVEELGREQKRARELEDQFNAMTKENKVLKKRVRNCMRVPADLMRIQMAKDARDKRGGVQNNFGKKPAQNSGQEKEVGDDEDFTILSREEFEFEFDYEFSGGQVA